MSRMRSGATSANGFRSTRPFTETRRNRLRPRQDTQFRQRATEGHHSGFSGGPPAILWHLLHMRILRFGLLAFAILPLAGCFQSSTLIRVKADGSGTIEQRLLLTEQALDQLKAFTILGGGNADNADPTAEPQARALAAAIGPGVTYVSSMPVADGRLQGRVSTYSFADVTQLQISEQPSIAGSGGPGLRAQGINTSSDPITFALDRKPNGNVILRILVPRPGVFPTGPNCAPQAPTAEQIAMMKSCLAGARLTVVVEPEG